MLSEGFLVVCRFVFSVYVGGVEVRKVTLLGECYMGDQNDVDWMDMLSSHYGQCIEFSDL